MHLRKNDEEVRARFTSTRENKQKKKKEPMSE